MKMTRIEIAGATMKSTGLPRAIGELTRPNTGTLLASIHLPNGKTETMAISTGSDEEHVSQRVAATLKLAKKLDGNEDHAGRLICLIMQFIETSKE